MAGNTDNVERKAPSPENRDRAKTSPENRSRAKTSPENRSRAKKPESGKKAGEKKKKRPKTESQTPIRVVGWMVSLLLAATLVYFLWFEIEGKKDVLVNPLNNRTANMEKVVRKGDIMSSDSVVLATTQNAADGTEYRLYPFNGVFAHTLGYTPLGGMGLESTQKIKLLTCNVNFLTQMRNELVGVKNTGDKLVTTLDYRLSQFCYDQLAGRNGAIIAMEPKTGKVLAMVSSPNFNPNTIREDWSAIISEENTDANLVNRASQGAYPPGSTFKLITLLEYIREHPSDWQDFRYTCTGLYEKDGYTMGCHGVAHGEMDIFGAFAMSCNGAFDTMAESLDAEKWDKTAKEFGYNTSYSFEFQSRRSSFSAARDDSVPVRMQLAIGQGSTITSPLINLLGYCSVANGGVMMKPYLIDRFVSADGKVVEQAGPEELQRCCTKEEAELLNTFLTRVINEGTAGLARTELAQVAGKTGSAQYSSADDKFHAWFCGYAPAEDPKIAVCVFLERGGQGGDVAAPVAGSIFDYYFRNGY